MKDLIKEFFSFKNIAILGATAKKQKWGYKVFKSLNDSGYECFPVNPFYKEIDEVKCYEDILDIKEKIDGLSLIISPSKTGQIIDSIIKLAPKIVWMQPGAQSTFIINKLLEKNIKVIYNKCVIVEIYKD